MEEGKASSILQWLIDQLTGDENNNRPSSFEDPEDGDDMAEARVGWGGKDLYDITITRV